MLDIKNCKYEDSWISEDKLTCEYYFTYLKCFGNRLFPDESEYPMCVGMTIKLEVTTACGGVAFHVSMSPTVVEKDGSLCDVDWKDLILYSDYSPEFLAQLLYLGTTGPRDALIERISKIHNELHNINTMLKERMNNA